MVTEHEHRVGRRTGEVVEPLQLRSGHATTVGPGPHGVENGKRDPVELDGARRIDRDRLGDHRVVVAAHVMHARAELRVRT